MAVVTIRQLLDSGVHFGHQTRRWNPKVKRFILTERSGIHIIDLQQSLAYIDKAYDFVKETVARGGTVLFVGTKKQAQEAIAEQATRVGQPYVNQRWLGGLLTNFQTVHKRLNRLKELDLVDFDDTTKGYTKKELLIQRRERDKLEKTLGGIRNLSKTPSRDLGHRQQARAPRGRRGEEARHPGDRHPRHERRPRRARLPDPGQRRRDPLRRAAHADHRRRRGRGPHPAPPGLEPGRGRAAGRVGAGAPPGDREPGARPPPRSPQRRPTSVHRRQTAADTPRTASPTGRRGRSPSPTPPARGRRGAREPVEENDADAQADADLTAEAVEGLVPEHAPQTEADVEAEELAKSKPAQRRPKKVTDPAATEDPEPSA